MSEESSLQGKIDDVDLENMKVIELKKKLKSFGLSVTGNKSELIERLQEAMISGKDISSTDAVEIDLDASLLNDSGEAISIPSASDNTLLDEFSLSSPEKETPKEVLHKAVDSTTNSHLSAVPLKKRVVAQAPSETVKVERKIVLKRNNIPTPKFIPSKPAVPIKRISVITEVKSEIERIGNKTDEGNDGKETCKLSGNVIRLSGSSTKGLSELERIQLRAKRFNIEPAARPGKFSEAVKQNLISSITSNTISTSSARMSDTDAKQRRAFRFGCNLSTTLKQLEQQQIMLKRKSKFGEGNGITATTDEQEKKKKRAERFGL